MEPPDSGDSVTTSSSGSTYERDRPYAEAMLRRLCLGAEIAGVYWSGFPDVLTLYIDDSLFPDKEARDRFSHYQNLRPGECWLMLEHKWAVLDAMPFADAEHEQAAADSLPEAITYSHLGELASLHDQSIVAIRLGIAVGHLMLQFDSGRCLFIHGDHGMYEAWEIRVTPAREHPDPEKRWLLVNIPGGDVAIWTPDDFDPNFDTEWQRPHE